MPSVSALLYTSHCDWIDVSVFDPAAIYGQIVQDSSNQTHKHTTICLCLKNITNCSLGLLGHDHPGQTLQVEQCMPCSGKEVTLHVETLLGFLPSSSCKLVHQYQLINLLKSYSGILRVLAALWSHARANPLNRMRIIDNNTHTGSIRFRRPYFAPKKLPVIVSIQGKINCLGVQEHLLV